MAEPLKYGYNQAFFDHLCECISTNMPSFNKTLFLKEIHAKNWEDLELKERMRRISTTLRNHLDADYKSSLKQLISIIKSLQKNQRGEYGYEYMFLPDYIEVFGQKEHIASLKAITSVTQFSSCEFAVRPFIIKDSEMLYRQMMIWAVHKHKMVRRLASEGFRPRLPWAMALPELKKDPSPLLPMLELLINDEAETVRRSVANNLNDISKDHPNLVIELAQKWYGESQETDWVIKHACRSLLKQGIPEVMEIFGLGYNKNIQVSKPDIKINSIQLGDHLEFNFELENKSNSYILVRLEYAIYYQKANGSLSKKVYKISEKEYPGNTDSNIIRRQSFKPISTRKFHSGLHQLALVINGKEFEKVDFSLQA